MKQLRDEVQASGAKLVILSLSSGIQVNPTLTCGRNS